MTTKNSTDPQQERDHSALGEEPALTSSAADDQRPVEYEYGHGRMPFFMKIVWLGFLAFGAWYVVGFLLASLGEELG